MSDYTPIACADYDTFEIAIMQRRRLALRWREGEVERSETVAPRDLRTESGEEFLLAESAQGEALKIRLDRITAVESISDGKGERRRGYRAHHE